MQLKMNKYFIKTRKSSQIVKFMQHLYDEQNPSLMEQIIILR